MARLEAGDAAAARALLEEALQAAPDAPEVLHGLARALDLLGERDAARELLERAHARAPTEPGPACDLAMTYLERGEDTRAREVLAPVVAVHATHPAANLHLALALAKTEPRRAREHLARVLQGSDAQARQQAEALDRALAEDATRRA
ncbi:tetratricopeptide repeat protein [Myxococcaceae bacterium JPH2]|nr:tetratricopeptide repeat protein [Myxococcaceae bacterium JPH2]